MKMHFTKMLSVCCAILLGAFLTTETNAQCLTAGFGQWPSADFTPVCDGSSQTISSASWTDEYSVVNVIAGEEYTFSSSVASYLITISADDGATAAASGTGSVTWTAAASGTVRFYTHLSAACDGEQTSHSRNVACGTPLCPGGNPGDPCDDGDPNTLNDEIQADCSCEGVLPTGGCENSTSFPSAGEDLGAAGNALVTISTCSFTTEYTQVFNVPAGEDIEFAIVEGGYITVRSDSAGGPVVAEGNSPVTVSGASGADLYAHWTLDAACSGESSCVETQVQCVSCAADCPGLGNIGDPCDDGNPDTVNDEVQADCTCAGIGAPDNDRPCEATELVCGDSLGGQSLLAALPSGPNNCAIGSDKDLWYKVTTDGNQTYRFNQLDVDGDFFDAFVEVYEEGTDCEDLIPVVECQDFEEGTFLDEIDLPSAAGTYYVRVLAEFASDTADVFSVSLTCSTADCPGLGDIGDSCDDGNPNTFDDVVTASCTCEGTPVDCPGLGNIGDACDDGDPNTNNDSVQPDCTCSGVVGCLNTSDFGSADLTDAGSALTTISTCSFETEYATITGVPAGEDIEFTSSGGGYITVREGTFDGPVVAEGFSPVTVPSASGADLFPHWTVDEQCNTATDCIETTVQCTSCAVDCPGLGNIGDPCDDGNPNSFDDTVQPDCSCAGILPPVNDNCTDLSAQFLLNCGDTIAGSTVGAQPSQIDVSGCGFNFLVDSNDVWYAFQANGTDNYTVTVAAGASSTSWDGVLYVYSGANCGSLVEVGCSDTTFTGGTEAVELIAPAAGIYRVQLYDYSGEDSYEISLTCESSCQDPFPAVDEASLSTTFTGNSYLVEWDPVPFQIGCQVQVRLAGASTALGAPIIGGATAGSFNIPGFALQPGTDYEWRVRCGCSQTPLVAGPFSSWQPFTTPGGSAITSSPNPTEGQSFVNFSVVEDTYTTLEVIDMSGRVVGSVFAGMAQPNNEYRFEFDGSDLPNGVYIYRLTTEDEVINEKFMIAR